MVLTIKKKLGFCEKQHGFTFLKVREDTIPYVAYLNHRIVGCITCVYRDTHVYIREIEVLPEYRGYGIARFLIKKIGRIYAKWHIKITCINCQSFSAAIHALKTRGCVTVYVDHLSYLHWLETHRRIPSPIDVAIEDEVSND